MRCPCHVPALVALVAAALSACAPTAALMTPPPSMKPPAGQADESTGEVAFSAGGMGSAVTYGPWNLKGDGIGLAYAGGGRVGGNLERGAGTIHRLHGAHSGPRNAPDHRAAGQ
jgi:opacity protein-like surface antigen